jgi:3-hydroxybutyryl-CoA dehydrogenase
MSIAQLASAVDDPSRFVGTHFFNPVPKSELVEIVTATTTSEHTIDVAHSIVRALGKEFIQVRDTPGFATGRLGVTLGIEAIRMVEEGVALAQDIDKGMHLGYRLPMGPLELTDLVGFDVRLSVAQYLADSLGPRFEPPQLLRDKVARGELGSKAGHGFYVWENGRKIALAPLVERPSGQVT